MPHYYPSKSFGSGWFDCCEPQEPICNFNAVSENQFNDGGCVPEPLPCVELNDGFGSSEFGYKGGFGGSPYTECGWAATKGWTWWNPNGNYCCDEPKRDLCDDDPFPESGFGSDTFSYPDSCFDPCDCGFQNDVT